MGKGSKQTLLKRRQVCVQSAHENTLSNFVNRRMPIGTVSILRFAFTKTALIETESDTLAKMQRHWKFPTLLVGMQKRCICFGKRTWYTRVAYRMPTAWDEARGHL